MLLVASLCAAAIAIVVLGPLGQARGAEETPLLPNLVADAPDGMVLETSTIEGTSRLLLRFNGYVHNTGPGAVDFRGNRAAPKPKGKTEKELLEEVEAYKAREETLPQSLEEELATPPMTLTQRLYTTNEGNPSESEKYLERPHVEQASNGEMFYVSADGHHHWHLQRVARYSLWNAGKSAEVAPAQKVGFCLEDSQHVETSKGPSTPVYADNVAPFRRFCRQFEPNATSVYEGISPGWRDLYNRELALQWVDASNVLPGEYWLREDVDPTGIVKQAGGGEKSKYATTATIIPGFDAQAQSVNTAPGEARAITLASRAWNDSATPRYSIVTGPKHGTLGTVSGSQVTYTPEAGYTGPDSFTFSAADPNSPFPRSPAVATVAIEVAPPKALLVGDATTSYSVSDQTAAGREEAFQFTAKSSGTVEELQFRTNGTANSGVTSVKLGVFAENAGVPGAVLGQGTVSGQPPTNSWIRVTGMSIPVVSGTKYWLMALPQGGTSRLHYNAATGVNAGTGNVESIASNLTTLTAESSWEKYNQGPVGFQALGTTSGGSGEPSVTIEGAPASMTAGSSVQLTAHVTNDSSTVTWKASAGSITTGGLYTAPAEPPAGGSATVTATTSKGAEAHVTITITAKPPPPKTLLVGDATTNYSVGDQTASGREESFQFTAKTSGTVEELQFRTNSTANPGVTSVKLGIFAENAGVPGAVLGQGSVSGEPPTNSWIKVTGLSIPVVSGTKYWLMLLPQGGTNRLHYNAATGLNAGTGNVESIASNLTTLTAESSWEKYNQGPVGFQALGTASGASLRVARVASLRAPAVRPETGPRAAARRSATSASSHRTRSSRARVMIEGLPSTVSAGATLQLAARVAGARPGVSWSVTAGSITSAGLLRAPARPVPGEKLVIRASSAGARDERTVSVAAPDAEPPAPSVYLPEQARATGGHVRALGQPQTMLVGDRLVITTSVGAAGRTTVAAYAGERRLGACSSQTPAGRDTTCIVVLKPAYLHAPIGVVARLSTATGSVTSGRAAARIGPMTMIAQSLARGAGPDSPQFVCSPALASINRRR